MFGRSRRAAERGFTLVELLVVMGIIAIMASVALPNIIAFMRTYQIRSAVQQVTGELQTARNKAIVKNVNIGVVFVARSTTQYQWAIEDRQGAHVTDRTSAAGTIDQLVVDPAQSGPARLLPQGIVFGTNCTGFTANDVGFRFNRLGAWCDPGGGAANCPAIVFGTPPPNVIDNETSGGFICLSQPSSGLTRRLQVAPGGRVLVPE